MDARERNQRVAVKRAREQRNLQLIAVALDAMSRRQTGAPEAKPVASVHTKYERHQLILAARPFVSPPPNHLSRQPSNQLTANLHANLNLNLEHRPHHHHQLQPAPVGAHLVAMFLWPIISGLLFSNAQYSSGPLLQQQQLQLSSASASAALCDSPRLLRCQQELVRDFQAASLNAASVQYPIGGGQGPPYSPAAKLREQQAAAAAAAAGLVMPETCRLVRANLDCVLTNTAHCYEAGLQAAHSSAELAVRAKKFLEQHKCNEPDTTWHSTFCFRAPEMRQCEERYGFTVYAANTIANSAGALTGAANSSACLAYQAFKYCAETYLRLNCRVHEMDMANEYLLDRAGDLAWRCPPASNSSALSSLNYPAGSSALANPYALTNPSGAYLSPSHYGHSAQSYEQRPAYVGETTRTTSLFGAFGSSSLRGDSGQSWERFRNPYEDTRSGISRLPGEVFDRLVAGAGFDADSSDCPVKAAPYARECEDTLIEQQRLARDSRDGNELQRRICCSLFQYRDCISRVVLDRCADSTPAAVEILMGVRRREMVLTCRGYNRDLCSGALASLLTLSPALVLAASILATLMTFKQQQAALKVSL